MAKHTTHTTHTKQIPHRPQTPPSPKLSAMRPADDDEAQDASQREQHALTHEDGDAETSGAEGPLVSASHGADAAGKAQTHETRQAAEREAQAAQAHEQRDPKWLGASAPKGGRQSAGGSGGHGYAPEIAHGEESGYGPADAAPGAHPRFGRQSAYGPHDDYAGTGRDASGDNPPANNPAKSRRVDWPQGTVGAKEVAHAPDVEGDAGQATGSRKREHARSHASAGAESQSRETADAWVQTRSRDSSRADTAIHDDIRKTLSDAIDLDVAHVEVTVTAGRVLLTGFVPERWMQHVVQTEVAKVQGVLGVDNRLHERRVKAMSRPGESQEGHKI
ncbi:BON domain-containing protein [Pandoraea anhela]|uniref:Transport-associated protein n=1 Tax=Pandoraea anhela TaxID=2508295 RepID=A0A5E4VKX7_9BURK|nr:BON domain-containing protein [Pandoraea anhela]VVE11640.1 transport-associated protein [Pandoraea anhela]